MSAGDRELTDRVAAAKQAVTTTKDAIRNIVAKDWGPLPAKTAAQRNIRAEHARLTALLDQQLAELADARAALGS